MSVHHHRRLVPFIAGLAAFSSTLSITSTLVLPEPAAAAPIDVDEGGEWGPVEDWPLIGLHAALDSDGDVVTYGTNGNGRQTGRFIYDVWDPSGDAGANHTTLNNTTETDLFCSLQINRADTGDMLLFGGDNWTGVGTTNTGNADINQLNAATGQITQLPGMNRPRWYGTGTTLSDGSIFVQGGLGGEDHPDHWTPENGAELLPLDTSTLNYFYPRNFVIPDGRIFGIDTAGYMYFISPELDDLDIVGRLDWTRWGNTASAVMYEPGKILHFGGRTATAVVIDVTSGNPVVTPTDQMTSARQWVNGTILPDGRVLATGGSVKDSNAVNGDPINTYGVNNTAEIWDPKTGQWTTADAGVVPRLYHSTALLLPDARVLVAGGGAPGPVANTNAEIYSPDYLVTPGGGPTPRLTINGVSDDDLLPGQDLGLAVSNGADVSRVTLVKTGSVTHSFNMDQRHVELPFTVAGNNVTTAIPASSSVVTPGYYLVWVLDENDIPSVGQMVRIGPASADTPTAVVDGQVVRLYQAYFQRNPDNGGFQYWRRQLLNGIGLVEISNQFSVSPEFVNRYGNLNNAQFIDQIYQNVLGRPGDAEGRAYWIGQLASGVTRGEIMVAFSESAEFVRVTGTPSPDAGLNGNAPAPTPVAATPAAAYTAEIHRLYLGYFGRAPELDGLVYWTRQREAGLSLIDVSEQFALSAEFVNRYGQADNGTFVDLIYANVLDRPADPGGRVYWIGQLGAGMTRGEMMAGFTESDEFVARFNQA